MHPECGAGRLIEPGSPELATRVALLPPVRQAAGSEVVHS